MLQTISRIIDSFRGSAANGFSYYEWQDHFYEAAEKTGLTIDQANTVNSLLQGASSILNAQGGEVNNDSIREAVVKILQSETPAAEDANKLNLDTDLIMNYLEAIGNNGWSHLESELERSIARSQESIEMQHGHNVAESVGLPSEQEGLVNLLYRGAHENLYGTDGENDMSAIRSEMENLMATDMSHMIGIENVNIETAMQYVEGLGAFGRADLQTATHKSKAGEIAGLSSNQSYKALNLYGEVIENLNGTGTQNDMSAIRNEVQRVLESDSAIGQQAVDNGIDTNSAMNFIEALGDNGRSSVQTVSAGYRQNDVYEQPEQVM